MADTPMKVIGRPARRGRHPWSTRSPNMCWCSESGRHGNKELHAMRVRERRRARRARWTLIGEAVGDTEAAPTITFLPDSDKTFGSRPNFKLCDGCSRWPVPRPICFPASRSAGKPAIDDGDDTDARPRSTFPAACPTTSPNSMGSATAPIADHAVFGTRSISRQAFLHPRQGRMGDQLDPQPRRLHARATATPCPRPRAARMWRGSGRRSSRASRPTASW